MQRSQTILEDITLPNTNKIMTTPRILPILLAALVGLASCSSKAEGQSQAADTTVVKRIYDIYADVFSRYSDAPDTDQDNKLGLETLYLSAEFEGLIDKVGDIDERLMEQEGVLGMLNDHDYWIMGQDVDAHPHITFVSGKFDGDNRYCAEIILHNFSDQKLGVDLVSECGKWMIDDFHTYFTDDNKKETRSSMKQKMKEYISKEM